MNVTFVVCAHPNSLEKREYALGALVSFRARQLSVSHCHLIAVFLGSINPIGPHPAALSPISADEFVQAIVSVPPLVTKRSRSISPRETAFGAAPKFFSAAAPRRNNSGSRFLWPHKKSPLIKDGFPVFNTTSSTGRGGFPTRAGDYIVTDKERKHVSTIYKVEMPYFMRLSCLDFGMHAGYVPGRPASHGCIRLPGDAARMFFNEVPVGTLVSVR